MYPCIYSCWALEKKIRLDLSIYTTLKVNYIVGSNTSVSIYLCGSAITIECDNCAHTLSPAYDLRIKKLPKSMLNFEGMLNYNEPI